MRHVGERNAHLAGAACLVDFGGDEPDAALYRIGHARQAHRRGHADCETREQLFRRVGLEIDRAVDDDAKQRLARAADDGAEPCRAVGDEACYRRPDLGAVEPHLQFLPLGGSRRLIGFGDAERIARRIELRLGDALPGDPRIERRTGDNLRPELLRALEVGRSLGERSLELADLALRLLDRRLGAKDGRVVLGEQGVELAAVETGEHLSLLHRVAVVGENLGEPKAVERRADHRLIARDQSPGNEQALDEFTPLGRRDAHGRRRRNGRLGGRRGPCGAIRSAYGQTQRARLLDRGRTGLKHGEAPAARDDRNDDGDGAQDPAHRKDSVPAGARAPSHSALNNLNARSPSASPSKSGSQATRCRRPLT